MSLFFAILGVSLLIVVHELGHFGVARLCDMRVLRFSVGFGPTLIARQVGETTWQLAAIPVGGFVQIHGMGPEDPEHPDVDPRSFRKKPLWQRLLVIFAGPATNWLTAVALVFFTAAALGIEEPNYGTSGVGAVVPNMPAADAGLREGDRVVAVGDTMVASWDELVAMIRPRAEQPLDLVVQRDEQRLAVRVTPVRGPDGAGLIGIGPLMHVTDYSLWSSVPLAFSQAWSMTANQAAGLWMLVRGQAGGQVSGLPGIVREMTARVEQSLRRFLSGLAFLSVSLCLLNLLPIPALDGSRLVFLGLEGVRGRPVDERIEATVHAVGFIVLLGLILFVSVRDVL